MSSQEWAPRRLLHDAGLVLVSRATSSALALLSVAVATRLVTASEYGVLALVLTTSSLVFALTGTWTLYPTYVLAGKEFGVSRTVGTVARARLRLVAMVLVPTLVAASVAERLGAFGRPGPDVVAAWLAAALGYLVCEQVTTLAESSGHYRVAAAVNLSRPLAYAVGLTVALVATQAEGLRTVLWILVASWVVGSLAALVAATRLPLGSVGQVSAQQQELVRAARPLVVFSISQLSIASVDLILIQAFGRLSEVGQYALAYQMYSAGALLIAAVVPVITPRLARHEGPSALRDFVLSARLRSYSRAGWVLGCAAALAPLTLRVLFGPSYEAAGKPLAVLLLALACTLAATLLHPALMVLAKWWAIGIAAALGLVVNTLLDVVLLGYLHTGIIGPSVATLVATAVVWIVYETALRKELNLASDVAGPLVGVCGVGTVCAVLLSPVVAASAGPPIVVCVALGLKAWGSRR